MPHKIRHFTWRACRDVIPTKVNLVRRKVLQDDQCEECHLEAENSNHLFWTCKRARELWECSKLNTAIYTQPVLLFQRYAMVPINGDGEFTGDGSKGGDLCVGLMG